MELDIEYEDSDSGVGVGDMASWFRRVADDWDGKAYDVNWENQQRGKMSGEEETCDQDGAGAGVGQGRGARGDGL